MRIKTTRLAFIHSVALFTLATRGRACPVFPAQNPSRSFVRNPASEGLAFWYLRPYHLCDEGSVLHVVEYLAMYLATRNQKSPTLNHDNKYFQLLISSGEEKQLLTTWVSVRCYKVQILFPQYSCLARSQWTTSLKRHKSPVVSQLSPRYSRGLWTGLSDMIWTHTLLALATCSPCLSESPSKSSGYRKWGIL